MSEQNLVAYEVDPQTPQPYKDYIHERNGVFAAEIAKLVGASGVVEINGHGLENVSYQLPSRTLVAEEAAARGIESVDDFYGGVVPVNIAGTKAALHQAVGSAPIGFSRQVAQRLSEEGLVLPGATAFTVSEAESEAARLIAEGFDVRFKDPTESDFNGQLIVGDLEQVFVARGEYSGSLVAENGLVIEVNLHDARTFSAGAVVIGGKEYTFVGEQKSVYHDGKEKFGGVSMIVIADSLEKVASGGINIHGDAEYQRAIEMVKIARDIYGQYDPLLSRFSFDVVFGRDRDGNEMAGIVDPTFRAGGLTPGELVAIALVKEHEAAVFPVSTVSVDVDLEYDPPRALVVPEHRTRFLESPDLLITATINDYTLNHSAMMVGDVDDFALGVFGEPHSGLYGQKGKPIPPPMRGSGPI